MSEGFIKLYRSMQTHWLSEDRPYCFRAAWEWLLLEAAFSEHSDGRGRTQKRGDVFTSQAAMSAVWGWDRKKTLRFLQRLADDGMISFKTDKARGTGGTIISIANYDKFQTQKAPHQTLEKRPKTPHQTPHQTPHGLFIGENGAISPSNSASNCPKTPHQMPKNSAQHKYTGTEEEKKTATDNSMSAAGGRSSVVSVSLISQQARQLYDAYPRHVKPKDAIKAIEKVLKSGAITFDELLTRVKTFAESPVGKGDFCPHPATWFNAEQFNDDPAEWQRSSSKKQGNRPECLRPGDFGSDGRPRRGGYRSPEQAADFADLRARAVKATPRPKVPPEEQPVEIYSSIVPF